MCDCIRATSVITGKVFYIEFVQDLKTEVDSINLKIMTCISQACSVIWHLVVICGTQKI